MKRLIGWTALIPVSVVATAALADPNTNWPEGYGYGHMWGGGWGIAGGIMMLVFWAAIIAVIVFAVRWLMEGHAEKSKPDAMATLRERFARGEIDAEEFETRKKLLES